ncbi:hypothetical protein IMZ48_07220 [Candidatus Bathyarchaeota archaeon]|nr:hypothetical protein [Candidatus Bathyarchaeota archaeon]
MYELSLLSFVEEKDVPAALTILTGVFDQKPWDSIHHVYNYRGPGQPVGMANPHPTEFKDQPDVPALWKDLDRALSRQSYSLQVRHEVTKEDFGKQEATDLNADPAKLRWVDFPEPPQMVNGLEKGAITQRKKLEIWGQKNLHSLVGGKGYT